MDVTQTTLTFDATNNGWHTATGKVFCQSCGSPDEEPGDPMYEAPVTVGGVPLGTLNLCGCCGSVTFQRS